MAASSMYTRYHRSTMSRKGRRKLGMMLEMRNKNNLLLMIFPVLLVAKIIVAKVLPDKYFFDNNRILAMALGTAGDRAWGGTYDTAANLFRTINVMHLETMLQWSICLGVLFTFLISVMIAHADAPDLLQTLFILATVGLLNIYIFTIGKDIIQFVFFFAVYLVLISPIRRSWVKLLLCAAILYYESKMFREYYALIAALVLAVYVVMTFFRRKKRINGIDVAAIVVVLFAIVYAAMVAASIIMPGEYKTILDLRAGYDKSFSDNGITATLILNRIPGDGLPIFMLNYVINVFRMMIPIELALRGAYYLPFFAFQCMVTAYVVNLIRQINRIDDPMLYIALYVYIGYALASVLFEPDFGSWTRHEAATFPVLMLLVLNRYQRVPITEEERMLFARPTL
ncbi:hypothetical protein [Bifidobacterium jacchi]|uniref:EpsG family protein n=1 Tax=Bifidobacterium jacchi TaxID=2490545 RepID=A0A5N5RJB9_9BIFI|nr:hypothetical protein [Bifidobacterium jacchi]KAB5607402.1 hypothetical protein EHS19_04960 [Bifidobacterium jacchi]